MNKVASTASPLLPKTPNRKQEHISGEKENTPRLLKEIAAFNLTPRRSSPKSCMSVKVPEATKKSPTLIEMERTLGINSTSPGFLGIFNLPYQTKFQTRSRSKRTSKRKTMMTEDFQKSLSNSSRNINNEEQRATRRSRRLIIKSIQRSPTESQYEHPVLEKQNWKVTKQKEHNLFVLNFLNTANLK